VNTDVRTRELYQLLDFTNQFSGNKIIAGDFNAWWGEWWITHVTSTFGDTWREVTGSTQEGHTIGNVRFDYLFRRGSLSALSCWVPYTELSDHRPVVADYRVQ
jgi:endonuclease/exonuclease/phosphatase (EEP) superfamily protein YafD